MEKKEFSTARQYLGKTQSQTAQLLGVSLKAIQRFGCSRQDRKSNGV